MPRLISRGLLPAVSWDTMPRPTFGPLAGRRVRARARRAVPAALARLVDAGVPAAAGWRLGEPLAGRGDTCVFAVRNDPGDDASSSALVKVAGTRQGRHQLQRQVEVLAALHADPRLGPWARLVPRTLYAGEVGAGDGNDLYVVVETRLPGADPRGAAADRPRVLALALTAIEELQTRTGGVVPLDPAALDRWVRGPAQRVRAAVRGAHRAAVDRLEAELRAALTDRPVARSWVHGDYNRTNVLFDEQCRVSGVVDWTEAEPDGLVGADAVTLLLWEPILSGGELGPVLLERLARPGDVAEVAARMQRRVGGPELPVRTLLLLGWLRHVGGNLADSARYAANPVWMHRNVRTVLAAL